MVAPAGEVLCVVVLAQAPVGQGWCQCLGC
jgi:hypothetical protein